MTRILVTTTLLGLALAGPGAGTGLAQPGTPSPGAPAAQTPHLEATLDRDASGVLQAQGGKGFDVLPDADPIVLKVSCTSAVDCNTVVPTTSIAGGTAAANWFGLGKTQREATFRASRASLVGNAAMLFLGSASIALPSGRTLPEITPLAGVELKPCSDATALMTAARDSGRAAFLVTFTGNVLARTHPEVDETDQVVVYVRGPQRVVERIVVRRTSEFRQLGGFPVVGEDVQIPRSLLRESTGAADQCRIATALVENFAGDKAAEIELSAAVESSDGAVERKVTGSFDFAVNRLYRGALSLGVLRTDLEDPSFHVEGTDSLIVRRDGGRRYLYALMLTPYILGRRSVEHWSIRRAYQYLNPTVGVVVDDIDGNALGGATLELPGGVFLTAGYHMGKVTRLPDDSPGVGARALPGASHLTEEHWDGDWFYSVSIDLRAASKLLNRLTGN
jgi:hypothetical protein